MHARMLRRTGWAAAVVVALGLLVPYAAASPTFSSAPTSPTFRSGGVGIVFPGAFPQVDLYQQANLSISAELDVDGILELAPGNLPHPTVVAAAYPTQVNAFNVTTPSGASEVDLTAALQVRTSFGLLWSSGGRAPLAGATVGDTRLSISYAALDGSAPASGVHLAWSVDGWPWVQSGDLLGLELHFAAQGASAIAGCTSVGASAAGATGCSGDAFADHTIVWDSALTGLQGVGTTGPVAALTWGAGAATPSGSPGAYDVGAMEGTNGSAELLLGVPSTSNPSGVLDFTLTTPSPAVPSAALHGSLFVVVATGAVLGSGAIVGLLLHRRRGRRLTAEL